MIRPKYADYCHVIRKVLQAIAGSRDGQSLAGVGGAHIWLDALDNSHMTTHYYCLLRGEKRNVCNSLSVENPFIGELPPGFSCPPALPLSLLCTGQTMGR